jgi:hypothetical protein
MKLATILLCAATLYGCKKPIENKRVETLDFKGFTVPAPAGWNEVTDKRMPNANTADVKALMLTNPPAGFAPSIVIQQLPPDSATFLSTATDDACKQIQSAAVTEAKAAPGPVKTTTVGAWKGCDWEMVDADGPQSAHILSLSNGTIAFTVTCNRDKKGAPDVDATCMTVVNGIKPKS